MVSPGGEECFPANTRSDVNRGMCLANRGYGNNFDGRVERIREYLRWMGDLSHSLQVSNPMGIVDVDW